MIAALLVLALAFPPACPDVCVWPHRTGMTEDSPGWDCRMDGNQICGPGNAQGVAPGYYGQGGTP